MLAQLGGYPIAGLDRVKQQLRDAGRPVFDFGIGDPIEETPPFIRQALVEAVTARSQYPTVAGQKALRDAAAGYLKRRFGVEVDPTTQVLPTAGSKEAIFSLPLALLDPKSPRRLVVMPDPGYPVYAHGTQFAGGISHLVALCAERGFLLEPADVGDDVLAQCAIFWVSYPHNPTGAVANLDYFKRVIAASQRYGFVVASDECYVDLHFGTPAPSVLEVTHDKVIAFHTCSKRSGMTGYRSGFMAGDPQLIAALKRFRPSIGTASPDFIQAAAAAAWNDDAHALGRRVQFAQKRQKLLAHFKQRNLVATWSLGTFYLWLAVPKGFTSGTYAARLLEEGIVVSPGDFFGAAGEGFVRIALVPSLEEIDQAIALWP